MFIKLPDAAIAMSLGTGLIGSSAFAKAFQSRTEVKQGVADGVIYK
jgi:hypothetical protein